MATKTQISNTPEVGDDITQTNIPMTSEQTDPTLKEIVFFEEYNPRSLINIVPDAIKSKLKELPPSLLSMSEKTLVKQLDPSWTLEQLRLAFWDEYTIAQDNQKNLRMAAVYGRICDKSVFYDIINHPLSLAYLVRPPTDYIYSMRSLLEVGLQRFREILKMDLKNPNGSVNTRLIAEVVKIVALVDNRVKGAVTQNIKIDSTQKSLNINLSDYQPPKTAGQIQQELLEIQKEMKELNYLPAGGTLPTEEEIVVNGSSENS